MLCFFKQKTAYEVRISDWSSDVCSSDLRDSSPDTDRHRHLVGRRSHRTHFHAHEHQSGERLLMVDIKFIARIRVAVSRIGIGIIALSVAAAPAQAGVGDEMSDFFNDMGASANATWATAYQGQSAGYYSLRDRKSTRLNSSH